MLENVLSHLKNWFLVPGGVHEGTFVISNKALELSFLQNGQYYRICGSVFNDGLHKYGDPNDKLTDEKFYGTVWALGVPKAVVELSETIAKWEEKNGDSSRSPFNSESFGGYSYTRATDTDTNAPVTWQTAFRGELNQWRKAREVAPVEPWRAYARRDWNESN